MAGKEIVIRDKTIERFINDDFKLKAYSRKQDKHGHIMYFGNLYYKGKKVASMADNGLGGDLGICLEKNDAANEMLEYFKAQDIRQALFEGDYSFYDTVDSISIGTVLDEIFSNLVNQKELDKETARLRRQTDCSFIAQVGLESFSVKFNCSLELVSKLNRGLLLSGYNQLVNEMKKPEYEGAVLVNTDEQLESLGLSKVA